MTLDDLQKGWEVQTRNNRFELKSEVQRCHDTMQEYTPGSKEYFEAAKVYCMLLNHEKENRKIDEETWKIIFGCAAVIGAWCTYRILFESSTDPFFREIGKVFIKFIPVPH